MPGRVRLAWITAVLVDLVQIVFMPAFAAGLLSPANAVVDLVTAVVMTRLVGWHWAFLPSFVAELIPGFDLIPTWTAAAFIATRKFASSQGQPPLLRPPSPRDRGATP